MADVTRLEQFLNHIAHPEDPVPAPQTRMEHNLLEIAENKGGGGLVVNATFDNNIITLDKTAGEIKAAITSGKNVSVIQDNGGEIFMFTVVHIYTADSTSSIAVQAANNEWYEFVALSDDSYPTYENDTQAETGAG